MNKTELGIIIRDRRKALKVTQSTLSALAGIGINTLVSIERGEANPKMETVLSILETLGLDIKINLKN